MTPDLQPSADLQSGIVLQSGIDLQSGTDRRGADQDGGPRSASVDPTVGSWLRSARRPALLAALLLLVVLVIGIGRSGGYGGYLDPSSASPAGGRALRVLLSDQGVTVVTVTSSRAALAGAAAGATLLVVTPQDAGDADLSVLARSRADLVLVDPTPGVLAVLAPWLTPVGSTSVDARDSACALPAAVRAGRALTGGLTVTAVPGGQPASMCYPVGGAYTVARATLAGGRTVTVVSSGLAFTNAQLATEGDAALALNLLGAHSQLVWYVAANTVSGTSGTRSLRDVLPPWVRPVELQLAVAVLLLALWQGRRFGPVVPESLPVVVRAAEAAEGRARLYQRAGARGRAADSLRAATLSRVVGLVGQSRSADPVSVTEAVAARTGRPAGELSALLYGAAPANDAALVRLATDLDELERMVRRT